MIDWQRTGDSQFIDNLGSCLLRHTIDQVNAEIGKKFSSNKDVIYGLFGLVSAMKKFQMVTVKTLDTDRQTIDTELLPKR